MASSPFDRLMRRCVTHFKTPAVYIRDGVKTTVRGIFDNDFIKVDLDGDVPVMSQGPQYSMHQDAIPFRPRKGDVLRIKEQDYRIVEPQMDSEFGVVLILKKA